MNEIGSEVQRLARNAVDIFQDRVEGKLDYSEASLEAIEEILVEAVNFREGMDDNAITSVVQLIGCYILETARAEFGGVYSWYTQRDQPVLVVGEPEFHVAIITWDKVRGCIDGDAADSIPFFYAGFADRVRGASPGTRVLYV
jgi:hypothetical protein